MHVNITIYTIEFKFNNAVYWPVHVYAIEIKLFELIVISSSEQHDPG